jgi:hypothetical protein
LNTELIDTKSFRQPTRDRWLAIITGIVACIIYALTVQRTVSFWDCGEFIASAVILGVPHPPGTPLFLLIGRLFSLLPVAEDISLRVNLVSVISGAGAVGLAYLVTARFLRRWFLQGFQFAGKEVLIIASSFGGAMLLGFAATVWNNAVEAEVYGITLAIFMSIMYAVLVWVDVRYDTLGPKLLIFATYMAVFGLGVHMMVYLAIPGMWLLVLMLRPDYRKDWRIYVGALAMMLVMATGTEAFLWNLLFLMGVSGWWLLAPTAQKRALKGWIAPIWAGLLYLISVVTFPLTMFESYGWGTFDWLATLAIFGVSFVGSFLAVSEEPSVSRRRWGLLGGIVSAAILAWSLQIIIPIRSHQDPRIDENNPETWDTFKGFLERKQYGQTSMAERMFKRRGLWQNQFGRHPRMGFWGFFEEQYVVTGRAFFALFVLGMLPFVVPFIRSGAERAEAFPDRFAVPLFLFVTLLATTAGLVVYMNRATRPTWKYVIETTSLPPALRCSGFAWHWVRPGSPRFSHIA